MNSFQDLNNYGSETITFTDNSDYLLIFGPFAGNANIVANVTTTHSLLNRQPIQEFVNSIKPLNVVVSSPVDLEGSPLANVYYSGNNANITQIQNNPVSWLFGNIWTISDYNELFANTTVTIEPLRQNDFAYSTCVNDQQGNSVTWYTFVDVVPFGFSRPTSVVYNEDQSATITGMSLQDISNQNYTLTFNLEPSAAGNIVLLANNYSSNTFAINGTRDTLNTKLSNNVRYDPFFDYTGNSNVSINIYNNTTGTDIGTANIRLIIGATHSDYTAPTDIVRSQGNSNVGTNTGSANLRITDLAPNCTYTANVTLINNQVGNLWIANTNYSNAINLSGNINLINANLANIVLVSNVATKADGNIRYVQNNLTSGLEQANVVIPVTYVPVSQHVRSGVEKSLGTRIGANATANVDFWCYNWNVTASTDVTYPGNKTIYRYTYNTSTGPNNGNVTLGDFRESVTFKWPSSSIKIENTYNGNTGRGITSAFDTGMNSAATGQFFSFWVYPRVQAGYYCFGGIINDITANTNLGSGLLSPSLNTMRGYFFHWEAGQIILSTAYPVIVRNTGQPAFYNGYHINLGTVNINQWTNITFQKSTGNTTNSTYSVWVNGQPKSDFRGAGSTSNPNGPALTGTTWRPYQGFADDNWYKFVFGAPLPPNESPSTTLGEGYFNNATNPYAMNMYLDDIVIANSAPYTNLASFTPVLQTYSGNVRQLWTGV